MRPLPTFILIATLLLPLLFASPTAGVASDPARAILAEMTPAERVGQLFIVSYVGQDVGPDSDIRRLVREEKVGGVVLLAANQNFVNDESAPLQVRENVQSLQASAVESHSLPLLVAIDHEGDGWPYSRMTGGITPLPSPMAIGATWNRALAEAVGKVTGQELAAAGINMILGPVVDVLSSPRSTSKGDLGIRVFGGDPYWVSQMGRSYISGVHRGSAGRVATVAKHFPGHGGSDRLPDDEVATVDKSLQELRRIELAPFFAITQPQTPDDLAVTDALMSSHIRYRGFQGNIRQFTAPISFDPKRMQLILGEEEFDQWRDDGVMVSDSLGVPAVKRYFDPTEQTFPHRQVAREALMAGNDLLILAQFALEDTWSAQLANMQDTLAYFREQYKKDAAFRQRVDEAALKVIRLKLKLYPEFASESTRLPPLPEPRFGEGIEVTRQVAEEALTLLYPQTTEEFQERLPRPPLRGEPIVIFTDAREVRDCFDCPFYQTVPTDALQQAITRRYGPDGTNQISENQIISFSFEDLKLFIGVQGQFEEYEDQELARRRAETVRAFVERSEWILLVMQDINALQSRSSQQPRYPDSDAARLLLDAAAGSLFDKKVVAFAFNVPYQLDTTEISKLSAAFGLYSKQGPFIDVAARALFQDMAPKGHSPVTVEAVNYDLPMQLEPDPNQSITLERVNDGPLMAPTEIEVQTSLIRDRNGNPVPDGTTVEITGVWRGDGEQDDIAVTTATVDGIARTTIPLADYGTLDLHMISGTAQSRRPVTLFVAGPTPTPSPTRQTAQLVEQQATPRPSTAAEGTDFTGSNGATVLTVTRRSLSFRDFFFSIIGTLMAVVGGWWFTQTQSLARRVRLVLVAVIGGMGGYLLWGAAGAAGGLLLAAPVSLGSALLSLGVARMVPESHA